MDNVPDTEGTQIMISVYQTRFGGTDAPVAEKGNCFQACLASILEIPLDDAFDPMQHIDEQWFDLLNEWLVGYGVGCVLLEHPVDFPQTTPVWLLGYHMMGVSSTTLPNPDDGHMVVVKDGAVVHDPNPNAKEIGKMEEYYIFVALDASTGKTHT